MNQRREIAINIHEKPRVGKNGLGEDRLFIPVSIYKNRKLLCGIFIPWTELSIAHDGDEVLDGNDGSGNIYSYICKQSNASGDKTFQQALLEVMSQQNN